MCVYIQIIVFHLIYSKLRCLWFAIFPFPFMYCPYTHVSLSNAHSGDLLYSISPLYMIWNNTNWRNLYIWDIAPIRHAPVLQPVAQGHTGKENKVTFIHGSSCTASFTIVRGIGQWNSTTKVRSDFPSRVYLSSIYLKNIDLPSSIHFVYRLSCSGSQSAPTNPGVFWVHPGHVTVQYRCYLVSRGRIPDSTRGKSTQTHDKHAIVERP